MSVVETVCLKESNDLQVAAEIFVWFGLIEE